MTNKIPQHMHSSQDMRNMESTMGHASCTGGSGAEEDVAMSSPGASNGNLALDEASTAYFSAVMLNNEGIASYESGHYERARNFFRQALECIKLGTTLRGTQDSATNPEEVPLQTEVSLCWSTDAPLQNELGIPTPELVGFIFRKALMIVSTSSGRHLQKDFHEESSAIIYNIAQCQLISGFLTNNSMRLAKARSVYRIVSDLRDNRREYFPPNIHVMNLLDVGVCNNVAWLCEQFCNFNEAREYYQQVPVRLVYMLRRTGDIDQEDCDGFIENLMLNSFQRASSAA